MRPAPFLLLALCVLGPGVRATPAIAPSDSIPSDLPLPVTTTLRSTAPGCIFAAVPYWGSGNSYLVIYDNSGKPLSWKRMRGTCTDFRVQKNGLMTYFDYGSNKFFAMDSTFAVVDSFWTQNGFTTDEHDIKLLADGSAILIGRDVRFYDMRQVIPGGDANASVVVNVIQEIDRNKKLVFEWKAYERYQLTDVGPEVNLLDPAFVHTHINSIDVDSDSNLVISSRNLNEITGVHRRTGEILWRFGGKNNQFAMVNDTIGISGQHTAVVLPNGHLLIYDNGLYHTPHFSRAVEYRLDVPRRTAELVWSYRNKPDVASDFWGNAQRLGNGNTLIAWGLSDIGVTEVTAAGEKVFEMSFPKNVYSYRLYRFPWKGMGAATFVEQPAGSPGMALAQNYPNPLTRQSTTTSAGSSTRIEYSVAERGHVKLVVYDVAGREVAVLVDEWKERGTYGALFAPERLPSGVYFYALRSNGLSTVKRLLYLR